MRLSQANNNKIEVSMAPMIDAVFLLLIFFLVATMMKKEDKDIEITPPESISAIKKPADDKAVVVGISQTGEFFYEGRPASVNLLHQELRDLSASEPDRQIRLDADAQAPFNSVVQVMDICQFRGLQNVVIRTYDEKYNRK
ncbi:ExbD/TolR family protein [Cerasicoccus arenae]|uniref:Biopolymer transporter ExbD n=1 Tax=Cerasicoccus arenae TaxID=424488 RepID=A0A8J3GD00_9BACT|nr:biopolymer transporter ExbD [Cerasicoccus arenae]MBK1859224.1 biopolymer transporter ExbD [Cerasicoccus arenae]GHC02711.1 biopolymer transporter ExbD [Cerasicoccus arenae]